MGFNLSYGGISQDAGEEAHCVARTTNRALGLSNALLDSAVYCKVNEFCLEGVCSKKPLFMSEL